MATMRTQLCWESTKRPQPKLLMTVIGRKLVGVKRKTGGLKKDGWRTQETIGDFGCPTLFECAFMAHSRCLHSAATSGDPQSIQPRCVACYPPIGNDLLNKPGVEEYKPVRIPFLTPADRATYQNEACNISQIEAL